MDRAAEGSSGVSRPMSRERRLSRLEGSTTASDAVLMWLAEAHQYPSLADYVRSRLDRPAADHPRERIYHLVCAPFQRGSGLRQATLNEEAARKALLDATFLYHLVLEINDAAEYEIADWSSTFRALQRELEALVANPLSTQAAARRHSPARASEVDANWVSWAKDRERALVEIRASRSARTQLERTWLAGRGALFPDLAGRCEQACYGADLFAEPHIWIPPAVQGRLGVDANLDQVDMALIERLAHAHVEGITLLARARALLELGMRNDADTILSKQLGSG